MEIQFFAQQPTAKTRPGPRRDETRLKDDRNSYHHFHRHHHDAHAHAHLHRRRPRAHVVGRYGEHFRRKRTTAHGHGAGRSSRARSIEEMITSPRQTCRVALLAVEAQKYMAKSPRAVHLHLRRFTKILIESRLRARGSAVSTRGGEGIINSHHISSPMIPSRLAPLSKSGQVRCRLGRKAGQFNLKAVGSTTRRAEKALTSATVAENDHRKQRDSPRGEGPGDLRF